MAQANFVACRMPGRIAVDLTVPLFAEADVFQALVGALHRDHGIHAEQFPGIPHLMDAVHAGIEGFVFRHVSNALSDAWPLGSDVMPKHTALT